jgi:hypothetical protein
MDCTCCCTLSAALLKFETVTSLATSEIWRDCGALFFVNQMGGGGGAVWASFNGKFSKVLRYLSPILQDKSLCLPV